MSPALLVPPILFVLRTAELLLSTSGSELRATVRAHLDVRGKTLPLLPLLLVLRAAELGLRAAPNNRLLAQLADTRRSGILSTPGIAVLKRAELAPAFAPEQLAAVLATPPGLGPLLRWLGFLWDVAPTGAVLLVAASCKEPIAALLAVLDHRCVDFDVSYPLVHGGARHFDRLRNQCEAVSVVPEDACAVS
jgi:hypothetical protein